MRWGPEEDEQQTGKSVTHRRQTGHPRWRAGRLSLGDRRPDTVSLAGLHMLRDFDEPGDMIT